MKWYFVTKKIGGRAYLYRQRTYREGGKVRTQSQYVGAAGDYTVSSQTTSSKSKIVASNGDDVDRDFNALKAAVADGRYVPGQAPIDWSKSSNPFWPSIRKLQLEKSSETVKRKGLSVSAMKAEYARTSHHLKQLGLRGELLGNIKLLEGSKAGWRRHGNAYHVTLAEDLKGSGRNRFKQAYRMALAHAFLDQVETQSPVLYDRLRTMVDRSWFNTKLLVTTQILKSNERHRMWLTLQFLWSGDLPKVLEKKMGKHKLQKLSPYKPGTWRDEAAAMVADVIQRGYKPSLSRLTRERAKAKANATRALTAYRKLGPLSRLTAKGRKKWKTYKKHEAKFLLAHHRKVRLGIMEPFLDGFHRS